MSLVPSRVVVSAYGQTPPDAIRNHLQIEAQAFPDVAELAPTDVVIAVRSAAVGWVDLLMMSGQYQHMASPPYTPGLEYSGEVAWVGAAVQRLSVGDRVLADGLRTGPRSSGPYQRWGGFASWAVAPIDAVLPLPGELSFDQGCNLLGNYETAVHALVNTARVQPGETVLVLGASGSTGLAAVHVASALGAKVIAAGRSQAKLEVVGAQGADHLVCVSEPDEPGQIRQFRHEIRALTGGDGVDVVIDGVGGATSLEALRSIRFGGRFVLVGWASTPFVARGRGQRGAPNANQLPTNLILMKGLAVLGSPAVIATYHDPSLRGPRLQRVWDLVEAGVRPLVSRVFTLDELHEALAAKWESRYVGGIVLHPGVPD